jgi:hypothetical protein
MQMGLGVLRLRPADFWAMSLPEWRAAAEGYKLSQGGGEADEFIDASSLAALEEAHPDG